MMTKFLTHAGRQIAHSMQSWRDRTALHEMPDAMLKDMGLSRADTEYYTQRQAPRGGYEIRR